MSTVFSVLFSLVLLSALVILAWSQDGELDTGDLAPDFRLQGSDGKTYSLSQFRGKKGVVVAWFPKAFTGG